jgi:hypothetical protein
MEIIISSFFVISIEYMRVVASHLCSDPKLNRNNQLLHPAEPISSLVDQLRVNTPPEDASSVTSSQHLHPLGYPKHAAPASAPSLIIHVGATDDSHAAATNKVLLSPAIKNADAGIVAFAKVPASSSPGRFSRKLDHLGE